MCVIRGVGDTAAFLPSFAILILKWGNWRSGGREGEMDLPSYVQTREEGRTDGRGSGLAAAVSFYVLSTSLSQNVAAAAASANEPGDNNPHGFGVGEVLMARLHDCRLPGAAPPGCLAEEERAICPPE